MNYPTFLKKVDSASALCDSDSLRAFVHEIARTLPEEHRDRFLSVLGNYRTSTRKQNAQSGKKSESLEGEMDTVLENLEEIQNGERCIEGEYNEDWDDWDGDWEDQFRYSDPDDVLDDIDEAVSMLSKSIDREEYEKGAALALKLSQLDVTVSGDSDESSMDITDLISHDLLKTDGETLLRECVYLAYMGSSGKKRAEAMVTIMENLNDYSITLENFLALSKDEIDVPSFLPSWISALASRPSSSVDKLLVEALHMLDDSSLIIETASRYAQTHPALYLSIMRQGLENASPSLMLETGLRAVKEVPGRTETRSEICLRTADYAIMADKREAVTGCWIEAFRSKADVMNYLRLRLLLDDWDRYSAKIRTVYISYFSLERGWNDKPTALVMFFDMRFDEVMDKYMTVEEGLGWTSTFMKEGIALFLMLLSKGAQGMEMEDMRNLAFNAVEFRVSDYFLGTGQKPHGTDKEIFLDCFEKWKKCVTPDDSRCDEWIQKIEKWVRMRTDAVMAGSKRNYYGECASFIAALGEVEESRGRRDGKQILMQAYRDLYSRRTAFHSELRRCGMNR